MQTIDTLDRFAAVDESEQSKLYNFEHFRRDILLRDAQRILESRGIRPGERAPDFELSRAGGGSLRLSDLRGRPVILHFGSFS
jgi:hypothetical protein